MANQPTIKQGSKGPAVKKAQTALTNRGYHAGNLDGLFGNQTRKAVVLYQTDHKSHTVAPLTVDGIIGPNTWARLDPPTIKKGATGNAVELLQERLGTFGFVVDIDGDFGPGTEQTLKDFQTWYGTLTVDGIAGPMVWTALGS